MATEAIFHRLAARDYRLAREWYADRSRIVAERFTAAVGAAVARITTEPDSFPSLVGSYRQARARGFPYVLVFRRRSANDILIVAVAHGRRRPGYWRRRE